MNVIPATIQIIVSDPTCVHYAQACAHLIEKASQEPDTAFVKRSAEYLRSKIEEGKAVIVLNQNQRVVGFCYIEAWENGRFIANSGLVIDQEYRDLGLAAKLKRKIFQLSQQMYPDAKLFGLTTSKLVMKINTELGYVPVAFSDLTSDDEFWNSCKS